MLYGLFWECGRPECSREKKLKTTVPVKFQKKRKKKGFCWEVAERPLALHLSKTFG